MQSSGALSVYTKSTRIKSKIALPRVQKDDSVVNIYFETCRFDYKFNFSTSLIPNPVS